ncbi:hypothetical protein LOTGIDRAFT_219658 [Lottia gigantea]|uniref:D-serine dehydratase-like domain-containing protein n=1 Tax=Lottia gigantea TaxID=225164 RepID=V3ZUJ2_LOTGI|nr:hypothetical protein LOTGIDRAFT_219658 [Lottia gigantea]ESO88027.1 hypothetical protein LOTGIDRAFT_219658 [Lottia gigantea]
MSKQQPKTIQELLTPCFVVDKLILNRNAEKMLHTSKSLGVQLRPHMKTQKTLEIGELMTGGTKSTICVSTANEAIFFSKGGFKDILYAVPISEQKIHICQKLVKEGVDLKLMFTSYYGVECMKKNPRPDGAKWSAVLEVDCGYGRTGVEFDSDELVGIGKSASEADNIDFMGLYTHCGDTYDAKNVAGIQNINDSTSDRLNEAAKRLTDNGIKCLVIGTGSTPGCNQPTPKMANLTEFHPGCYIFNDLSMTMNGANLISDIAIRVATRVIDHKKSKNYLIIDCGFTALSLDGIQDGMGYEGMCSFQGHPELKLKGMTQELGKVSAASGTIDLNRYPIGTILFIYPWHACHTAALHPVYYVHDGDNVTDAYRPTRGW